MQYAIALSSGYILQDKPLEQSPLRRLQREGGEVVEIDELIKIALGKVDGIDQALNEYGARLLTTLHSVSDIVDLLKIDAVQATRLLAILSIGRRLYGMPQSSLIEIRGIEDVYSNYRSMAYLPKEQLRALLINSRYQVTHEEVLAIGGLDQVEVSPAGVFHSAVERQASAIILVHNHPSGDPTPSKADLDFTKHIVEAGKLLNIEVLDHVVIAHGGHASCLERPEFPTKTKTVDK